MTTVTAIIPTHNRAQYLAESLASVLGQTRPPDEVIVVDDGSTDATPDVLAGYGERVRVLTKPNGGKATALNMAIPAARGAFVWIFDDDDVAMPDALFRHLTAHATHPDAGYTYSPGMALHTDADGNERVGAVIPIPDLSPHGVFYNLQRGCAINQQGTVVRRSCFDAVGPFNEALQRTQDYEFLVRLARRFEGIALSAPTFYFRHHDGPRGGAAALHDPAERVARFFAYERQLWGGILPDLSPTELLPADAPRTPWTAAHTREATIRRMMIAGRFGLLERVLDALDALGGDNGRAERLTQRERDSAWLTLSRPEAAAFAARDRAFVDALAARLARGGLAEIAFQFLRGTRHARRMLARDGRTADAANVAGIAPRMLRAGAWRWLPRHVVERTVPSRAARPDPA